MPRRADEDFAVAWADVEEATTERMEHEAYRRTVDGIERDVFYQGAVVGAEREYSDNLLMFLLKARRPERYRDNVKVELPAPSVTTSRSTFRTPASTGPKSPRSRRRPSLSTRPCGYPSCERPGPRREVLPSGPATMGDLLRSRRRQRDAAPATSHPRTRR